jgi:hypothetical protein
MARALLLKYGWNVDIAVEAITTDNSISSVFNFDFESAMYKESEVFMCESCYCEYDTTDVVTMADCYHQLCAYCFKAYLEQKVSQGPDCLLAPCPD